MTTKRPPVADEAAVRRLAREQFGFDQLRPGQLETIRALLAGRDTLAVLPTGAGKSAIYQLAGLLKPGPTMVISPLIALQRDQVTTLDALGLPAAELNSSLANGERDELLAAAGEQAIEFLFLAPEQLVNRESLAAVTAASPSLVVVDEAHCISEWGYDFRPDYLALGAVIEALGHPLTLALTATAAPPVRAEIIQRLNMRDPAVIVRGFDRPNIHLAVRHVADADDKRDALIADILASPGSGLVYAATRRATEELAAALVAQGCAARAYHAGLSAAERDDVQDSFMLGTADVIVATVAFGMGIDKPDVRFVFHAHISDSIDAYYQEVGRAGRDGEPARATLYYRPEDLNLRRFQSGVGELDTQQAAQVAQVILDAAAPVELADLREETALSDTKLMRTLRRLEDTGVVELHADGEIVPALDGADHDPATVAAEAAAAQHERGLFARSRVEMMRQYAETQSCRRAYILSYFGEASAPVCGTCDNCDAGLSQPETEADAPFPVGGQVSHARWGPGEVVRYEGETVTVRFDTVGYRTLSLEVIAVEQLLS